MKNSTQSLFAAHALDSPGALAAALAPAAAAGHFDEVRGRPSLGPAAAEALPPVPPMLRPAGSPGNVVPQSPEANQTAEPEAAPGEALSVHWTCFFNFLGQDGFYDLNRRRASLQRQIRDNGVTYNVYADANGPQRPWSLDLLPMLVSPQDWALIETGIQQRARLLDRVMADIYGPQQLLVQGLLPSALVHAHPGYLRGMHDVKPPGGTYLHIAAFDLAHGPDGQWSVVSQRTQAPSGLGYLLENRLIISQLFPEAFREMNVQRLLAAYTALADGLKAMSPTQPGEGDGRVVLLTPGPYNETYFEHAYLARFLGLTLVEGSDLMVRDDRLYLKTLQGLEPVHGVLKRLDDEFLDPLELRSDSALGVPGLLQVIRAGNVLVANMPGSAFLESSALLGFLPALSEHLLGETLALPSLDTWWCGEQAVMQDVLSQLKDCVIKPTYPDSGTVSVIGNTLSRRELDEWAGRIIRRGEDYTVQAYQPLSQTPTWQGERIAPRSAMLRVFAVADGTGSWQVMPGGLARLTGTNENIASMQHGGSSADVWVLGAPSGPATSAPAGRPAVPHAERPAPARATAPLRRRPPVTSRAAENLFWLGRYTERTENATRLAQLTLQCLNSEEAVSQPLLAWLSSMAVANALVLSTVPPATQSRRVFERALIANLPHTGQAASVGANLKAIKNAASAVRERLSLEQWHVIVRAEADFFKHRDAFRPTHSFGAMASQSQSQSQGQGQSQSQGAQHPLEYSSAEALKALESASGFLAAMTGAQTDRMTRDDGWRLLSLGRMIERLNTLATALMRGFESGAVFETGGFSAMVALFDSTVTFNAQYQQRRDIPALLDLLVLDRDNPRALGWVMQTLRGRLAKLTGSTPGDLRGMAWSLPDPDNWVLADLCESTPASSQGSDKTRRYGKLHDLLEECSQAALELSDTLSRRYFSHADSGSQSLGA
ncbi:circularly permuted type 2 ATP-grasp protein [Polaromonas jejuensis]|uniref:Circularly permuted type 2 ATP-grasp protein n=1 Tax=Polaromonas jejuensis TaxID=457502 RepID=A0ABW0Q3S0_9BURK|nr:circularly permuted type 2 ATP-grasp protein [Polaromonas jejuensis]